MGKISREDRIVMKALRVASCDLRVGKIGVHATIWKNLWNYKPKMVQIAPRSTYKKSGCWITNWQFYWSRSYVRLSLKVCSLYETYTWGYTWRPLACYLILNIKLASCHLLLYVVYMSQKLSNFIDVFICDKQKCKVESLNLAHSVCMHHDKC